MLSIEINFEELKKKNYDEIATLAIQMIDEHIKFETFTKAELIKLMAEKLYEAKYPQYEIRHVIAERLGDRVSREYLLRCLDERFKKPAKIAAGKSTAEKRNAAKIAQTNTEMSGSAATVLEEPEYRSNDDDESESDKKEKLPDVKPKLESETSYQNFLEPVKVIKVPKQRSFKLEDVLAKSKNFTILLIDTRTNEMVNAYTDTEWNKQTIYKK